LKTERHFFLGEANEFFAEKLHSFHDLFVETMLLCGVDEPGTSLDKIKLTKNPAHNLKYYKKIVGGLLKFPPSISISCIDQHQNLIAEMFFTHLDNGKDINGIFLTQNVYHWDGTDLYCVQVWSLKDIDLYYINNHWLD
tara:strand:- start:17941 stop:18357 length:417 start_codon:yes stop_codon:yes gene_type:complete